MRQKRGRDGQGEGQRAEETPTGRSNNGKRQTRRDRKKIRNSKERDTGRRSSQHRNSNMDLGMVYIMKIM